MQDHDSVLLKTTVDSIFTSVDGYYLDCTGGLGGHAAAILERLSEKGRLWICDYHTDSVNRLSERFKSDRRVTVIHSRFSQIFDNLNFSFHGIMADLGISSYQLAHPGLGIGFLLEDAPLDMRIDPSLTVSAAELLQTVPETELADLFFQLGGERASRKIAAAICMDRKKDKLYTTTKELKELCERVLGRFYYKKKIHPATKVFQALRIAVNREIAELKALLQNAPLQLSPGGRLAIISFHSGEDRLVKQEFRTYAATEDFVLPTRKAIKPSKEEIEKNPRSRSARLRVLEKKEI